MTNSFHIVNNSVYDLELYESFSFVQQNKNALKRLRERLSFIKPQNYKGIGRRSFTADPFYFNSTTGEIINRTDNTITNSENNVAKFKLLELEKLQSDNEGIDFYLKSIFETDAVFKLLNNKEKFEKIETIIGQREIMPNSYGFDIGYWCGDFAIIADTAIKPTWHPPDLDDMDDIVVQLKKLNKYCLFKSYTDALEYKEIYLSKNWAEENWHEHENDLEGDIKIMLVRPA